MERAAGHAGRQAARAGLLTAVALACATVQDPPGGPPDPQPPVLLSIVPDTGAVVAGFTDEAAFHFDEVLEERGLGQLFTVSPRHEVIDVSWHRKWIGVRPDGGWHDDVVYTITMLPGVADLRTNRSDSSFTLRFSTGGPIPATRISGNTVDWERPGIAPRSLVEAIRPSDSLTYFGFSDSTGRFTLESIPAGEYVLVATVDQNNNQRREARESFDSVVVRLDSTLTHDFWMFAHDTLGPRIRTVAYRDSLAITVEFNQSVDTLLPDPAGARVLLLPDSVPVAVEAYLRPPAFDSLRAAQADSLAALADSIAALADTLAADSIAPLADTLTADSVLPPADSVSGGLADSAAAGPRGTGTGLPGQQTRQAVPNAPDPAEIARVEALLAQRTPPTQTLVLLLGAPLAPDSRYVVETTVRNLQGAVATTLRVLVTPTPPDSS